jgi:hypothetical protein
LLFYDLWLPIFSLVSSTFSAYKNLVFSLRCVDNGNNQDAYICYIEERSDKRTNNTMAKREGTKGQTIQWPREKGQKNKQYNGQERSDKRANNTMARREVTKGQTIQWPREKGQKDKQHNGQERRDKRTNNTMAKREGTKGQTIQWPREKGQNDKE